MDRTPFHGLLYVAAGMYVQNKINILYTRTENPLIVTEFMLI